VKIDDDEYLLPYLKHVKRDSNYQEAYETDIKKVLEKRYLR
jgi:hypothetical protein